MKKNYSTIPNLIEFKYSTFETSPDSFDLPTPKIDPTYPFSHHDILNLIDLRFFLYKNQDSVTQLTIAHGLSLFGLKETPVCQAWLAPTSTPKELRESLYSTTRDDYKMLKKLWTYRRKLVLLPETWAGQLEGHPITGGIWSSPHKNKFSNIADQIISLAHSNIVLIKSIDSLIMEIWGSTKDLEEKEIQELIDVYPDVVKLNAWFGIP